MKNQSFFYINSDYRRRGNMYEKIKTQYEFSDFQMEQLRFLFKSLFSEFTKIIIMGFFFIDQLPVYFLALFALALLRTSTGGLHCQKYFSCLCVSFIYVLLCIRILPLLYVNKLLQMLLLLVCLLLTYYLGPVTSSVHLPLAPKRIKEVKLQAFVVIFLFLIATYILPENPYITVCFWIICLHTIQLLAAKILKKGVLFHAKTQQTV